MGDRLQVEKNNLMKKLSLKTQFIVSFIFILILSIIATIITYYFSFQIYQKIQYKRVYPANYYEKKVIEIEDYIWEKGLTLLDPIKRQKFERIIPKNGILYQVLDQDGNIIYGSSNKQIIQSKIQFYKRINTTAGVKDSKRQYSKLVPILDSDGNIRGGILLLYTIPLTLINPFNQWWTTILFMLVIFSPFIYIIAFTLGFSKVLANSINKPLNMLINATRKIKEKNLDFQINYSSSNELGELCGAFNDMKIELEKSLISRWKLEQERQEMIETLAHDLKTPLSIVQGYAESLLEGGIKNEEKLKKYISIIKENAVKSSNIVNQMQYAIDLDNTDSTINNIQVDIAKFLHRKIEEYRLLARGKNIRFNLNIKNIDNSLLHIDVEKLERILDNIISNSIRYTPNDGYININVYSEENKLFFKVCDSGKGFSKKDLSNLFNKFYKGDEARSSKDGHSGLGLYITKKLVQKHGGDTKAFNSDDGGACIEFYIELQKV